MAGGSTASENVGGRRVGIRPGDLVGAITGEAGVESRSIGAIEINDGFSLAAVPDALADQIIDALRATKVRELRLASEYRGPWPLTVSPEKHSSPDL